MTDKPLIQRYDDAGVTRLLLDAPESINSLSEAMMDALCDHLDAIATDSAVRAVILGTSGKHFCAGHNLKEMTGHRTDSDGGRDYFQTLFNRCSAMMLKITQLPQPVIAEVRGIATAAGCQLVATCDLAVAADDARFATSGVNIGLFCSTPMVAVSRNIMQKHALEMLLTGDFLSAERVAEMGLINRAVPLEMLEHESRALADKIASKSPVAIRMGKRAYYEQAGMTLEASYQLAARIMAENMMAQDTEAGIQAFINKQPMPEWSGQ